MPKPPIVSDVDLCSDPSRPNFVWGGLPNHRRMFLVKNTSFPYNRYSKNMLHREDGPAVEHFQPNVYGDYWSGNHYISGHFISRNGWRDRHSRVVNYE